MCPIELTLFLTYFQTILSTFRNRLSNRWGSNEYQLSYMVYSTYMIVCETNMDFCFPIIWMNVTITYYQKHCFFLNLISNDI